MARVVTYNNEGNKSKEWEISLDKLKYLGIFNDLENDGIDITLSPIPLIGIRDIDFQYIYDILDMSYDNMIIYLQTCDIMHLYCIYIISDFLIIEMIQKLSGLAFSIRLNKMNMYELTNIINKLFIM